MIEIKNETEKVILVGVSLSDQDDTGLQSHYEWKIPASV